MYSDTDLVFRVPDSIEAKQPVGMFARRILLVSTPIANESLKAFLDKVFSAAQIQVQNDTLLLEVPKDSPFSITPLLRSKSPLQVVVFGLSPEQIGLHIAMPLYQPLSFYDAQFLFADSLDILEPDRDRKGKLWTALKTLFLT